MSRISDLRFLATCFDLTDPNERKRSASELLNFYLDLVTAINPDVAVEIGAFDASFSQAIKQRLPHVRAVAFEANPYNFNEVVGRVAVAGIEYLHKAVSDVDGTVTFNIMAEYAGDKFPRVKGNDSLLQRTAPGVAYEQVVVPSVTADTFFGQAQFAECRPCLWIDVEGAASKVIEGATKLLARTQSVLIEVEDYRHWDGQWLSKDVDAAMASHGLMPVARDFEYENQFNVIYVNASVADADWIDQLLTRFHSRVATGRAR